MTTVCANDPDAPAEITSVSAHHLRAMYKIVAEIFTGKTVTLDVGGSDTIDDVHVKVYDKTSIPPRFERFILDGKVLRVWSLTLREVGVEREPSLRLMGGLDGGVRDKKWLAKKPKDVSSGNAALEFLDPKEFDILAVFVGGWARHGVKDWMVKAVICKIVGCNPAAVIDTTKSGLILKHSDSGSVMTILNSEAMCRDHKLRVFPSRQTTRTLGTQTGRSGNTMRTIINDVHANVRLLARMGVTADWPTAGALTPRYLLDSPDISMPLAPVSREFVAMSRGAPAADAMPMRFAEKETSDMGSDVDVPDVCAPPGLETTPSAPAMPASWTSAQASPSRTARISSTPPT